MSLRRKPRGTRPGSIRQLRLRLWWAIDEATALLEDDNPEARLRAISALSTAAGVYAKLTETQDLERRLDDLQKEMNELREAYKRPAGTGARTQATVN
jgi:hypothetical protein